MLNLIFDTKENDPHFTEATGIPVKVATMYYFLAEAEIQEWSCNVVWHCAKWLQSASINKSWCKSCGQQGATESSQKWKCYRECQGFFDCIGPSELNPNKPPDLLLSNQVELKLEWTVITSNVLEMLGKRAYYWCSFIQYSYVPYLFMNGQTGNSTYLTHQEWVSWQKHSWLISHWWQDWCSKLDEAKKKYWRMRKLTFFLISIVVFAPISKVVLK